MMGRSIAAGATHLAHALRGSTRRVASAGLLGVGLLGAVRPQAATVYPPPEDGSPPAYMAQRGTEVSLQQAIAIALTRYPGRVVRAESTSRDGLIIYEIRILSQHGRVRTVRIDAMTSRFM